MIYLKLKKHNIILNKFYLILMIYYELISTIIYLQIYYCKICKYFFYISSTSIFSPSFIIKVVVTPDDAA